MLLSPDFSEIKDEVSPGTYKCMIRSGTVKEWPRGGMYVNWEMETYGESDSKNNGRRLFHKTPLSGGGAFKLQQFYKAATGQALDPSKPQFDTEQLNGAKVEITLVDGTDKEGKLTGYTDVKSVRPVTQ